MPINFSELSQKQIVLSVVGVLVACILLVLLGNMYGGFLKTQVAAPGSNSVSGSIKGDIVREDGTHTLQFTGMDSAGKPIELKTDFNVVAAKKVETETETEKSAPTVLESSVSPTPEISQEPVVTTDPTSTPVVTETPVSTDTVVPVP